MTFRFLTIMTLFGVLASSCGVVKRGTIPWEDNPDSAPVGRVQPGMTPDEVDFGEPNDSRKIMEIKESLELAYNDWKGVPYILGGTGFDGVDCSAFMQIVFEDYFSRKLPRNTREQLGAGKSIRKDKVKTGDLVFFKTGPKTFHVGVMVNDQEFLHASTSSGVMISDLKQKYWEDAYYGARRIL